MTSLAKAAAWVFAMGAMIFAIEMMIARVLIENGWRFE